MIENGGKKYAKDFTNSCFRRLSHVSLHLTMTSTVPGVKVKAVEKGIGAMRKNKAAGLDRMHMEEI